MDAAPFEQIYGAFGEFHSHFSPLFGRRETRDRSQRYLQALLVQSGEAEERGESVGDGPWLSPVDAAVPDRVPLGR